MNVEVSRNQSSEEDKVKVKLKFQLKKELKKESQIYRNNVTLVYFREFEEKGFTKGKKQLIKFLVDR